MPLFSRPSLPKLELFKARSPATKEGTENLLARSKGQRLEQCPRQALCWVKTTGNLANMLATGQKRGSPENDRCEHRYESLGLAQQACAAATGWCKGVTKDSGIPCTTGVYAYELRTGPAVKGSYSTWVLMCRDQSMECVAHVEQTNPQSLPSSRRAQTLADNFGAAAVHFDPEKLPASWWLPSRSEDLPDLGDFEPRCESSTDYVQVGGDFGQTNNILQSWAHALEAVAPRQRQLSLVSSSAVERDVFPFFQFREATRGWACVVLTSEVRAGANRTILPARETFFLPQMPSGPLFVEAVLGQLLLRPRAPLRNAVLRFERKHFDPAVGFNAVHLRSFESKSPQACASAWITSEALACQSVRRVGMHSVRASDLCEMSDAYLDAALATLGEKRGQRPLLLAHDGQQGRRAQEIIQRFGAIEFDQRSMGLAGHTLFAEMLLAIRARNFIGNPGSTFSLNVARVRRYALGPELAATNLDRSCDYGVTAGQKTSFGRVGWKGGYNG